MPKPRHALTAIRQVEPTVDSQQPNHQPLTIVQTLLVGEIWFCEDEWVDDEILDAIFADSPMQMSSGSSSRIRQMLLPTLLR